MRIFGLALALFTGLTVSTVSPVHAQSRRGLAHIFDRPAERDDRPRARAIRPGDPRDRDRTPRSYYGGRGDARWRYDEVGGDRYNYNYPSSSWNGGAGPF